jgi:hypothetical protein
MTVDDRKLHFAAVGVAQNEFPDRIAIVDAIAGAMQEVNLWQRRLTGCRARPPGNARARGEHLSGQLDHAANVEFHAAQFLNADRKLRQVVARVDGAVARGVHIFDEQRIVEWSEVN